jgi:hypothetical protein
MNRQRIVSLMLGLATLLAVGIVITQAALNDPNPVIIKQGYLLRLTFEEHTHFHLKEL